MASKLRKEELVTLSVMAKKGQSNGQIAHVLGVTEGAIRTIGAVRDASMGVGTNPRRRKRRPEEGSD